MSEGLAIGQWKLPKKPQIFANLKRESRAYTPALIPLIAWLGRAAKMFISQNIQELKRFQRAARVRDERTKRGCKGSRFAFLDLRRFAVSLAISANQSPVLQTWLTTRG